MEKVLNKATLEGEMSDDQRTQGMRRSLNEVLLYRNGEAEPAKLWMNVGCGIVAWWMVSLPELVWKEWIASCVIAGLLIAPDIAKKIINLRLGGNGAAKSAEGAKP